MAPSSCMFLYQLYSPQDLLQDTCHTWVSFDKTLMARFRTATHHNMMLDPAILCSFSCFVTIALVDVKQLRRFLTIEYYTIGAKVGILLSVGNVLTGKCSQSLRESRAEQSPLQHRKYTCRSQKQRSPGPLPWNR